MKARAKRVRITLDVDAEFVGLLQACVQLHGLLGEEPKRMEPMHVLAVVALGELRGATEAEVHARTPVEWRPHVEVVHEERRWLDEAGSWHVTGAEPKVVGPCRLCGESCIEPPHPDAELWLTESRDPITRVHAKCYDANKRRC